MRSLIHFRGRRQGGQDRVDVQSIPAVGQEVIFSVHFLEEALAGFPNEGFYTNKLTVTINGPIQAGSIITVQANNTTGTARIDSVGPYTAPGETRETPVVVYATRLT